MKILENDLEAAIVKLLELKGYKEINKSNSKWLQEREINNDLRQVINKELLLDSLKRINNKNTIYGDEVYKDVIKKIEIFENGTLFQKNHDFHKYLINGMSIDSKKYRTNPYINLIDFENIENNVFEVVRQLEIQYLGSKRIPDAIIYVNGLPLVVFEFKSFDENNKDATLDKAFEQLGQNKEDSGYRYDIESLFIYNAFLVVSDLVSAKVGTITSDFNRFSEWKSVNGERGYDSNFPDKINVLIDGLFEKKRFLDVLKNNLFFIEKDNKYIKIISQYHQYFGVKKAYDAILKARKPQGDGRAGIIWHTQGSGKSFSMLMLAKQLLTSREFSVPIIVVLTDRIDLDDQLYSTFSSAKKYLRLEEIKKASSRNQLVKIINSAKQGAVIFTTIGKFDKNNLPENTSNNIIVMTDEAHRSHYGIDEVIKYKKDEVTNELKATFNYGIEKYIRDALPNATFIGFTGTPVSTAQKQTTKIFGEIIDTYDITQSIIDGSTVKLYYESRKAKAIVNPQKLEEINMLYNSWEANSDISSLSIEKSKQEMSKLKVILEDIDIIEMFAKDIIAHFSQLHIVNDKFINGKAMVVCQTRKAAYLLYKKICELDSRFETATILVATETNKDSKEERDLFGNSRYRQELATEFKKKDSKYRIAIVCDMWLTGFDAPDLEVIYFIKRLRSHNLMQAIARVNRVYKGKNAGLVVDYIGIDKDLKDALNRYTERDKQETFQDVKKEILKLLVEKLNELNTIFKGVDASGFYDHDPLKRINAIKQGVAFVQREDSVEKEFIENHSLQLKQSFQVCSGVISEQQKDQIEYYLAIRSFILRLKANNSYFSTSEMNKKVELLLEDSIKGDEVEILTENKETNTNLVELLNPEKIKELRESNPPSIFIEIIKKMLQTAIREARKDNIFQSEQYSERLLRILDDYNGRTATFEAEPVIETLIDFAQEMVNSQTGFSVQITGREKAFYDALIHNKHLNFEDATLKVIAHELVPIISEISSMVDWAKKENLISKMRTKIKECLQKYNYPPEYREEATNQIVEQAKYSE
ncbi:type I restriction endonuclease subunit R [Mycoplasma procyoni]|uniref:type I restriction endonuclease subunit R n=1 Tax=Mycoplasma procyoni TaxID=568784 RepID=UPI00197B34C4|nr:type I restriction endonuclease subunit R [Mycoplasma procyoni]MBN3534512.1 type I restriction endonuclease subunit R [Mycoplasma procyoni]